MRLLREGGIDLIQGLYALCPYILGSWPHPDSLSSVENNGIFRDLHNNQGRMGYGIEAFEAGDPLGWPSFATVDDVQGLPPTMISVNECDPLRGTIHGTEVFTIACPDISRETANGIAPFARGDTRQSPADADKAQAIAGPVGWITVGESERQAANC